MERAPEVYQIRDDVREYVMRHLAQDDAKAIRLQLADYYGKKAQSAARRRVDDRGAVTDHLGDAAYLESLSRQFYYLAQSGEFDQAMVVVNDARQAMGFEVAPETVEAPDDEARFLPATSGRYLTRPAAVVEKTSVAAEAFQQGMSILVENYRYRESIEVADLSARLYHGLGQWRQVGEVMDQQADLMEQIGDYHRALKILRKGVSVWRRAKELGKASSALLGISLLHQSLRQPKQSLKAADQALALRLDEAKQQNPELFADSRSSVRGEKADRAVIQVESLISPDIALLLDQQGIALRELGRFGESLDKLQQSINIKQKLNRRLSEALTWKEMGMTYFAMGQAEAAAQCFNRSLQAERATDERSRLAKELRAQGLELEVKRLYAEAQRKFNEALRRARESGSELCDQIEEDVRRIGAKIREVELAKK